MIKKTVKIIFFFIIFGIIFLGVFNWFLGLKTEEVFKAAIHENEQVVGEKLFRVELLSYQKNLIGAEAHLRVSSDLPLFSEKVGEFQLKAKLLNGPIFFTKSGFSVGSSRWFIMVNETSLSEEGLENLKQLFPQELPTAIIRLDFKRIAHYQMHAETAIASTQVTGRYNVETFHNRGAIELKDLQVGLGSTRFSAPMATISYQHDKALTAAYKPGTSAVSIPSLNISDPLLSSSLHFNLKANSDISLSDRYLNGFLTLLLKQKSSSELPLSQAKLSVLFKGLSADGFVVASEAHADLDNLHLQAEWELDENGEFPEGQDQINHLYQIIEEASTQMPELITKGIFNQDSLIQFKVTSTNQSGDSEMIGQLSMLSSTQAKTSKKSGGVLLYKPSNHQEVESISFVNTLLSLVQGSATVKLDPSMLSLLSKQEGINKKHFSIHIKNGQLMLR